MVPGRLVEGLPGRVISRRPRNLGGSCDVTVEPLSLPGFAPRLRLAFGGLFTLPAGFHAFQGDALHVRPERGVGHLRPHIVGQGGIGCVIELFPVAAGGVRGPGRAVGGFGPAGQAC